MPENRDTDWDWEEFFQRNNNELVATWGNLVNRVLSFTWKNFEGQIPNPGELRSSDRELLEIIKAGFGSVGNHIEKVELKAALAEAMRLATEVNKYLDVHAPWFEIKTDRNDAAKSLYTAIQAIEWLKIMFAPFLPEPSQRLHLTRLMRHPCLANLSPRQLQIRLARTLYLGLTMRIRWRRKVLIRGPQDYWRQTSLSISQQPCLRNLITASSKKNALD